MRFRRACRPQTVEGGEATQMVAYFEQLDLHAGAPGGTLLVH
ncbi:hypothetical protein [Stutzerimonas zhaodongensis]